MKGTDLKTLRAMTGVTQDTMAHVLTVSPRTLAKWEAEDQPIARPFVLAVRHQFEDKTVGAALRKITNEIFRKVPSERVNVWLVRNYLSILLSDTGRRQCLRPREERSTCPWNRGSCTEDACHHNPFISKPMGGERSLTTLPLRTGETLCLIGKSISEHPQKLFQTHRNNAELASGLCNSLLYVPIFLPSEHGPRAVALVGCENKLSSAGSGGWQVCIPLPEDCEGETFYRSVYTPEEQARATAEHFTLDDERNIKRLLKEFMADELGELLAIFDY